MKIQRKAIMSFLSEFSPWHNIRIMGKNVKGDLLAGLTVAVIALPLALAFGVASGLGAIAGVWGAICGGIFVGLFGGSNVAVSGPTGPKTVQLASILQNYRLPDGGPDLVFVFGVIALSGLIIMAIALLRVGKFIYYTPYSVVSGFMCGIGAIIITLQINPFLGLPSLPSVTEALKTIPSSLMNLQPSALLISSMTIGTIFLWSKASPIKWIPGPLIGLIVGTTVANLLGLDIKYIGEIPTGIPKINWPDFSRIALMIAPATALAGLAIFDSLMTCLVADNMTGERHSSDREIFGQGIANLMAGLLGGLPTATATMRTVANIKCGAKTPLAAFTHGVVLLSLVLGLAPYASIIPLACLAGILVKIGLDILDYRVLPILHKMPLTDKICFFAVFLLTILVDLLVAMGIGLVIAFFRFVQEMSSLYENKIVSLGDSQEILPGKDLIPASLRERILILSPEGPLFFGTADMLFRTIESFVHHDVLIVCLKDVPTIDLSGAFALDDLIRIAQKKKITVLLTSIGPRVRKVLDDVGIIEKVGTNRCFDRFEDAVEEAIRILPLSA